MRRRVRALPRIEAGTLADMLKRGEAVLVLDVRSAAGSSRERLAGAIAAPLGSETLLVVASKARDSLVVTYCDCPGDATAANAAMLLARHGSRVQVLAAGLDGWRAAGLPLEGEASAVAQPVRARGSPTSAGADSPLVRGEFAAAVA
jgi:rhodanese-related sulfurtransferase